MTVNRDLFLAMLSMDSYNRGYGFGIKGLSDGYLGLATIENDSFILSNSSNERIDISAGFYAIAYNWNGETIISYRGTDNNLGNIGEASDIATGYDLGVGIPTAPQALLATDFYKAVAGDGINPFSANITTTGHSLGGGLAGFAAAIFTNKLDVKERISTVYPMGALRISYLKP